MQTSSKQRQMLIIGAAVVVLLIVGVAIWYFLQTSTKTQAPQSTTYYDPASKQTISSPDGKAPETYGTDTSAPIFLGDSALLDYGVSGDQLDSTKQALQTYSFKVNGNHNEVSIWVDTVTHTRINDGTSDMRDVLTFDVTFKRTTKLHAKLEYFDITNIQLFIYSDAGAQLYDSGVI